MIDGKFELEVCLSADDPKPLRQYGHEGRTFIEGKPGTSFVLVFRNQSSDRVLVVPSVDGVSVMDGQQATPESEGYVVEPYRRVVIKGWRTSLKDSAKFVFEKKDGSYAEATGQGGATGVIGCLVYREKKAPLVDQFAELRRKFEELKDRQPVHVPVPYPVYPSFPPKPWLDNQPYITWCGTTSDGLNGGVGGIHTAGLMRVVDNSGPQAINQVFTCSVADGGTGAVAGEVVSSTEVTPDVFTLGTGWGEAQKDEVKEVEFTRGKQCGELTIYYSVREQLQKIGVRFDNETAIPAFPEPFKRKFCAPPKKK